MIVIEGKNEKSLQLEKLIEKEFENHKVLIMDLVGYKNWSVSEQNEVWAIEGFTDYKEFISEFVRNYEAVKEFDTIVFYVNADVAAIESFKEIDRNYPHNFIVIIQTDGDIKIYQV